VNRHQVNSASANVDLAAKQLNNCTIVAPTTGIVLSKKAELGGYVNPLAFGAAGYLCEMADLGKIEVELSIQERDFAKVMPPKGGEYQICSAMPDAFRSDDRFLKIHPNGYDGYVSRVMPVADRAKGAMTVRVRIRVPDEEAGLYLKPDMSVIVTFRAKTTRDTEKE
jgi:multidrug resistance efflux pump